jgi:hypothetical protein
MKAQAAGSVRAELNRRLKYLADEYSVLAAAVMAAEFKPA